jgi:GT2 family glycosyltransferase
VPFFSIIVPAYNRAAILDRAIGSCLAQTYADFELVVVDDGSVDDTAAVIRAHADPRLVYLRQENAGASAARNRGVEAARGAYVAFLDSDDAFLPGKLAAFRTAIDRAGPAAARTVWYSRLYFDRGAGNRRLKPGRAIAPGERVGDYLFADDGLMQTSTLVLARELCAAVRFDERLRNLEDLDLCLRLEAAGAAFAMLPEPLTIWHDDRAEGRLSHTTTAEHVLAWTQAQDGRLSRKARSGFLARYFVPVAARRAPLAATRLLGAAALHRSVSAGRAASLFFRGIAPGVYARVRDALTAGRNG